MAAQLGQRERELVATNDRLTVMASIDMLSGLANRRGFQSRLDFEWMKAQQYDSELSLLMIDVDHLQAVQRYYGHPEGDACLSRLGETLSGIAAETMGFCRPLWRRGILPAAAEHRCRPGAGNRRDGSHRGPATGDASRHEPPSNRHRQRRRRLYQAERYPAAGRPDRGRRRRPLRPAKHRGRNAVVEHGFVRITDGAIALAS